MANHPKCSLVQQFFLLICIAAIVAGYGEPDHQHPYYPQPQDFPSEQLYHAYFVIQRFKNTITCDPRSITNTWTGHDICATTSYLGFHCGAPHGQASNLTVTSVIFDGYGLCSPVHQDLVQQLPDLALFQASSNNFGGEVPILIGLSYMYMVDVHNGHSDQFEESKQGGSDTSHLSGGCFNNVCAFGNLPPLLPPPPNHRHRTSVVTSSKAFLLNNNQLTGHLPSNLGFSKLSYLALANNKLTGPIPQSIGQAQDSLLELLLLNNQLSGCLPHELGMLTKTTVIDAGKNQLTGPIPSSFSCLTGVEQLNLGENRLYGQVPDALCKLGRLANLTLSGNYFSSVGPACSALIKDGVLDVKRNCVPGLANQRAPAECASFMSQPKASCPAASAPVSCPAKAAADAKKMAPEGRAAAKDYASYVTYATLHE